jgi:hypothetical protein
MVRVIPSQGHGSVHNLHYIPLPACDRCLPAVGQNPWWHPSEDDRDWDEPLPNVIVLAADYMAPLPLWGEGSGNIAWQSTKFPPELLDRLATWQQDFDHNYHHDTGWRSDAARDRWAHDATDLAADVQTALVLRV